MFSHIYEMKSISELVEEKLAKKGKPIDYLAVHKSDSKRFGLDSVKVSEVNVKEVKLALEQLDVVFPETLPEVIKDTISTTNNIKALMYLIGAVKEKTGSSFTGPEATGNELTLVPLEESELPDGSIYPGQAEHVFRQSLTAGKYDYMGTSVNQIKVDRQKGMIIFGFLELVPNPIIDTIQLKKGGTEYPSQEYNIELFKKVNFYRLPRPYTFPPDTQFCIRVQAKYDGISELRPVGLVVKRADESTKLY